MVSMNFHCLIFDGIWVKELKDRSICKTVCKSMKDRVTFYEQKAPVCIEKLMNELKNFTTLTTVERMTKLNNKLCNYFDEAETKKFPRNYKENVVLIVKKYLRICDASGNKPRKKNIALAIKAINHFVIG